MKGVKVYEIYLALKAHFNTLEYDYFLMHGKTKAGVDSYINRKDYLLFEGIAKKYTTDEILPLLLSNFIISRGVYIGYIAKEKRAHRNYTAWIKRTSRLSIIYSSDLRAIVHLAKQNNIPVKEIFLPEKSGVHSTLIKLFIQNYITIETLVLLNRSFPYIEKYDKIYNDPLWEELSLTIKKYSSFVNINDDKYKRITKNILLDNQ